MQLHRQLTPKVLFFHTALTRLWGQQWSTEVSGECSSWGRTVTVNPFFKSSIQLWQML